MVLYSQTYMLVQQSFLVRDNSPITSVSDLDRPGRRIGANSGDSVALYLKTHFKQATIVESPDYTLKEGSMWLADGEVHIPQRWIRPCPSDGSILRGANRT